MKAFKTVKAEHIRLEFSLFFLSLYEFFWSFVSGGISAYNAGPRNVQSYDRMDIGTTHDDYSNDVVARAQYYKKHGY